MPKKESAHQTKKKSNKVVKRATRKQTNVEKRQWNGQEGGGPGRPKGSKLHPHWKLTPNQMGLAEKIITVESKDGIFPGSIAELADAVNTDRKYLREMLRREDFQRYLHHLLLQDGIMLEMAFWRGMQLGLQVGDARVLHLYAQMTGKIAKKESTALKVELVSPDGSRLALPTYEDEGEIEDAIIIEDEDENGT